MSDAKERLLAAIDQDPALVERLLLVAEPECGPKVYDSTTAKEIVAPLLLGRAEERLVVVALDHKRQVLATTTLTIGSAVATVVDPRQIYRWALLQGKAGATAILLAHNHPSGDSRPSTQDIQITERVLRAGKVIGITLLDHLIVVDSGEYVSLSEEGVIPQPESGAQLWTS